MLFEFGNRAHKGDEMHWILIRIYSLLLDGVLPEKHGQLAEFKVS